MNLKLNAKLETRTFKNGNFEVLVIQLSKNVEKIVFLTSAELEILKVNYTDNISYDDMPDLR